MSEYFMWVNPKKKELIEDEPFDEYGYRSFRASTLGCLYTDAACTLLAGRWRGDPIAYLGDYYEPKEGSEIAAFFDEYPNDESFYDKAEDYFENIGGLFRCAEGKTRRVFDDLRYDELYRDVPYEGSFSMEVRHFRYALNRTRGEYVDRDAGPVKLILVGDGGITWDRADPMVPLLTLGGSPWGWDGRWCCDEVEVLDELPVGEFEDITKGGWTESLACFLFVTDEEMAALVSSDEFARGLEREGISRKADGAATAVYPDGWVADILESLRGMPDGA